ncbi:MAG TPA: metallophosphoesterase [Clostridia bacterium]|nr:metallophosphoesterase [Clostridia bacterium]
MKSNALLKKLPFLLIIVLALTACFSIGSMFLVNDTAFAAAELEVGSSESITIAHITDIHYFPLEYSYVYTKDSNGNYVGYVDKNSAEFLSSAFNDSTYGDTKLVTESGAILNSIIQNIITSAKAKAEAYEEAILTGVQADIDAALIGLHAVPDYMVLSGDLTKNAERVALIDVANAFRYLQNQIRAINYTDGVTIYPFENFQIFATPGNHDLYNASATVYDNTVEGIADGTAIKTDTVSTKLFSMIFAGLGFPDVDTLIMDNVLREVVSYPNGDFNSGLTNPEYWYGDYTGEYVYTTTAKNLKFSYYNSALQNIHNADPTDYATLIDNYAAIDSSYNVLSYVVEILNGEEGQVGTESAGYSIIMCDATDREITEKLVPIVASANQIKAAENLYTFDSTTGNYTKLADYNVQIVQNALTAGKVLYYNAGMNHLTGGKVTEAFLNWLDNDVLTASLKSNDSGFANTQETIIFSVHHNVLPHFDKEDDLLKDFTVYNWEYVAKRLLNMGVRYTLTGHMHSSDIASYTDAAGNVLYDFQTGSTVSFTGPSRYVSIDRDYYFDDAKYFVAEKVDSQIIKLESLKEVQSSNITTPVGWIDVDVADLTTEMAKFEARFAANPDYFLYSYCYDDFNEYSFNEYIDSEIYGRLTERMLDHFLNMNMIDDLRGSLETFFNGTFRTMLAGMFADYADVTYKLVDSMIDQLLDEMTYTYDGKVYASSAENTTPGLLQMVRAIADDFLDLEFGDVGHTYTLRKMVVNILTNHTTGREFTSYNQVINGVLDPEETDQTVVERYYFGRALRELILECESGEFVEVFIKALLNPILLDDTSLLKTLIAYNFNFTNIGLNEEEIANANSLFSTAIDALNALVGPDVPKLTTDIVSLSNFSLGKILDTAKGFLDSFLVSFLGVSIGDNTVIEFAEDFISKYMVDSFYTGTGGLVKDIVVAFSIDTVQDNANPDDLSIPYFVRFARDYEYDTDYAIVKAASPTNDVIYTYVQGQCVSDISNPATTENGRLPSKISSNFDTAASTTAFAFSYYTDEDVYAKFEILDDNNAVVATVQTSPDGAVTYNKTFTEPGKIGWETRNANITSNGIVLSLCTTTMPAYVPLIDLGVLCLTHTEVSYEIDDNEYYYSAGMRDGDLERSSLHITNYVVYKNRHTVNITGLSAGTTYRYRIYGTYENNSNGLSVNKEFSLNDELNKNYFTFTTAAASTDGSFNFLAIADLQASIRDSYIESKAILDSISNNNAVKDYDFILNAGDMVDNGKNFYQWGWALDSMAEYFANTSMFITAGNHEESSNTLDKYFNYTLEQGVNSDQDTESGLYYSFDYGTLHLVVLNTNDTTNKGLGTAQLNWLKADLAANTSKWTVVLMHKGIYSAGSHSTDFDIVAMRAQLTKVFAEGGVDVVLSGHDHTYTTTCIVDKNGNVVQSALDENGNIVNNDIGVVYITLGTLGEKFYNYVDNEIVTSKFDSNNTIEETLTGPTFAYFSFDGDNLVITNYKYSQETNSIERITAQSTDIKITKRFGTAGTAVANAKINDSPLVFGQDIKVSFFSLSNSLNIDMSQFPEGSVIEIRDSKGNVVNGLNLGFFSGKASFEIRVIDSTGYRATLGVVTLARDGFTLYTTLLICGIAVIIAAIVVVIILVLKKKKSNNTPDGGDDKKEISPEDEKVESAEKTSTKKKLDLDDVKQEITTDVDTAVEKPADVVEIKGETKAEVKAEVKVETEAEEKVAGAKKETVKKATTPKTTSAKTTTKAAETADTVTAETAKPKAQTKSTAPKAATTAKTTEPKTASEPKPKAAVAKSAQPKATSEGTAKPKTTATKATKVDAEKAPEKKD